MQPRNQKLLGEIRQRPEVIAQTACCLIDVSDRSDSCLTDGHASCVDSKLRSGSGSPWLALGAGCGHCLAIFPCRWRQWLMAAPPVLSPLELHPAPFYTGARRSLQISNGTLTLISSRQASPRLHHLFLSRLRWDLRSVPLVASSTPASLASWLHEVHAHLAHPSLLIP